MIFTISILMWLVYTAGIVITIPILFLAWVGFKFLKDFDGGFGPWRRKHLT